MKYINWCSRSTPGCIYIVVDKNSYMSEICSNGKSYAERVSNFVNQFMAELFIGNTFGTNVKRVCKVTIFEYGDNGVHCRLSGWIDKLAEDISVPLIRASHKVSDGIGGYIDVYYEIKEFVDSKCSGITSPMEAFRKLYALLLSEYSSKKQNEYFPVPIIIHVTSEYGLKQDVHIADIASKIQSLDYLDGNPIIFNCVLTHNVENEFLYPNLFLLGCRLNMDVYYDIFQASSFIPEEWIAAYNCNNSRLELDSRTLLINPVVRQDSIFFMQFGGSEPLMFRQYQNLR